MQTTLISYDDFVTLAKISKPHPFPVRAWQACLLPVVENQPFCTSGLIGGCLQLQTWDSWSKAWCAHIPRIKSFTASELVIAWKVPKFGVFPLYSYKAAFWFQEMSPRLSDVERSVVLWSVFAISSTLAYLLNVPLLHTSRYVIAHDSVLPGLPLALVLQATNAVVRRPGYEARIYSVPILYGLLNFVNYLINLVTNQRLH